MTTPTDIHQLLTRQTIGVGCKVDTKQELLSSVVDLLRGHPAVLDLEAVREAVFDRERVMSTGVGKGLGLPHAKTSAVSETVAAFATTARAVDYGAIDNRPVQLVFLLVGTEAAKTHHIKLLSRVSRLMNRDELREQLMKAADAEEVLRLFEEGESSMLA